MTERQAEYRVPGQTQIREGALLPFADPRYQDPTGDEVREALRRAGLTGAAAGELLGVSGRTIRKWIGEERKIPYSAWRLLLMLTGLVDDKDLQLAADR